MPRLGQVVVPAEISSKSAHIAALLHGFQHDLRQRCSFATQRTNNGQNDFIDLNHA